MDCPLSLYNSQESGGRHSIAVADERRGEKQAQIRQRVEQNALDLRVAIAHAGTVIRSPVPERTWGEGEARDRKEPIDREENLEENNSPGYGVLVSDLVGGTGDVPAALPQSFMSVCAELLNPPPRIPGSASAGVSKQEVAEAIIHHFGSNTKLWLEITDDAWEKTVVPRYSENGHNAAEFIEAIARTASEAGGGPASNIDARLTNVVHHLTRNPNLHNAVKKFLKASLGYCHLFMRQTPDRSFDFAGPKALEDFIASLCRRRNEGQGGLPDIKQPAVFTRSVVHGDLNANNLTWAKDYKRFFLIDFEHTTIGFQGADQLKLVASLICEGVSDARRRRRLDEREKTEPDNLPSPDQETPDPVQGQYVGQHEAVVRQAEHSSVIRIIRMLVLFREYVMHVSGELSPNSLAEFLRNIEAGDAQAEMIKLVIGTINLELLVPADRTHRNFWLAAVRNIMFKQFEYPFRDLDERHIPALNAATTVITNAVESKPAATVRGVWRDHLMTDPNSYVKLATPTVIADMEDDDVISLFCSLQALLAVLY